MPRILHEELETREISAKWVTHLLNADQSHLLIKVRWQWKNCGIMRYELINPILLSWHPQTSISPTTEEICFWKRFASNKQVERTVDEHFNSFSDSLVYEWILMLRKRWTKHTEINGNYIETLFLKISLSLSGRELYSWLYVIEFILITKNFRIRNDHRTFGSLF